MDGFGSQPANLGARSSRPWIDWALAIISFGLGVAALLVFILQYLPSQVTLVGAVARPNGLWLLLGATLLLAGAFFTWRAYQWRPPLADLVRAEKGIRVQLDLEGPGDSSQPRARLKHFAGVQEPFAAWRVELSGPTGEGKELTGRSFEARAYFDPDSGLPAAVRFGGRLYSVIPGAGKVEIVPISTN